MKKKFKVSDFAEIVGCTPKTVYKMIERNELKTVTEKVNNRETTVIVATDEQIKDLQGQFGKLPVNDGECNEIVTDSYSNEPVKNNNNLSNENQMIDKIIDLSREYTDRLTLVNEELVNAKSQMLFLTDKLKSDNDSKDYWQKEYFKKDYEVKQSEKSKFTVIIWLVSVIFVLILGLIALGLLYSFEKQKANDSKTLTGKDTVIEQQLSVTNKVPAPAAQQNKNQTTKKARYHYDSEHLKCPKQDSNLYMETHTTT